MSPPIRQLPRPFVEAIERAGTQASPALVIPWPMPGQLAGFVSFDAFASWLAFVESLGLNPGIPEIVAAKFLRAQKLMLLAWIDFDMLKASEMVGLASLELALRDSYGRRAKEKYGNMVLGHLLRYMPEHDGLTDAKVPMNRRCNGGTVVGLLTGVQKPSLADIRNDGAHGYPFDGFPFSGLLELVRDLIEYAYRDRLMT